MNNDLANFIVEFSTKGLEKVESAIKGIGEKVDNLGKSFDNADKKSGGFIDSLGAVVGKLGLITAAIATVTAGINTAFDVKDKTLDLQRLSAESGVAAQNIEALGISLRYGFGGDIANAGNFYRNLVEMRANWRRGKIGKDEIEEMARAGFTIDPNAGLGEWIGSLADALSKLGENDIGSRNLLANAFGLDDSMMLFLSEGRQFVQQALEEHGAQAFMYKPENVKAAADLNNAIQDFKIEWQQIWAQIQPLLTGIIVLINKYVLPVLNTLIGWLVKLLTPLIKIADWVGKKIKEAGEAFVEQVQENPDKDLTDEEKKEKYADETGTHRFFRKMGELANMGLETMMGPELYAEVEAAQQRNRERLGTGNTVVVPVNVDGKRVTTLQVNPDASVIKDGTPMVMGVK